jgi:hypothetical protein
MGISFKSKESKGPETGKIRTYQRGDKTITEEWTGKEWKEKGAGPKFKPESKPKIGTIRKYQEGDNVVTEEWTGKEWKEKATGPKFAEKESQEGKKLKDLKKDYWSMLKQYNNAKRGVGQFVADPNKEQVAEQSLEKVKTLAAQYITNGGNPKDLGISPEDIKAAVKAKALKYEDALIILNKYYGMPLKKEQ